MMYCKRRNLACSTLWLLQALTCVYSISLDSAQRSGIYITGDDASKLLEAQLQVLGLNVRATAEGPGGSGTQAHSNAYIIKINRGTNVYKVVEDVKEVASFVSTGGLVIVMDSSVGTATHDFIADVLRYSGKRATIILCFTSLTASDATLRLKLAAML